MGLSLNTGRIEYTDLSLVILVIILLYIHYGMHGNGGLRQKGEEIGQRGTD